MQEGMSERRTHRNLFAVVSGSTRDNVMDRKIIQQYAHLSEMIGGEVRNTRDGQQQEALRCIGGLHTVALERNSCADSVLRGTSRTLD